MPWDTEWCGRLKRIYAGFILFLIRPALELARPHFKVCVMTPEEVRKREAL